MIPVPAVASAPGPDPALTISLALASGILCQALAHHLRLPGIVLLLAAGAVLGPDALGVIHPEALGDTLQSLVGFAVAVILFEGGMNLQFSRLRRQSTSIQRLVTVGALVTAVGGALAARVCLGWDARTAILFGTLVIVTGPTVVGPLVRRIKLHPRLRTVVEGEGVLIDPVGAIIAVVALEVGLRPSGQSAALGLLEVAGRLGGGTLLGLLGGFLLVGLLRPDWLIPPGLRNVTVLSLVLALFHLSNALQPESGIATVTVAGLVVGNLRSQALEDLLEFKEQLTVLFIGMLFVLLSADVRFAEIRALGVPGLLTVAVLMVVVRPLSVLVSTAGTSLSVRERVFLSWMAPRGIVAAAVASFFAVSLDHAGIPGGASLRALVFLVIAVTVLVYGLTGGWLARRLGLILPRNQGYLILGASDLGRALGRVLGTCGQPVTFLDSNSDCIHAAEQEGFGVVFGNALEERTLIRARADTMTAAVALTPNEEVNLLFLDKVRREFPGPALYLALHLDEGHVTREMIHRVGARMVFGGEQDIDLWSVRLHRGLASVTWWIRTPEAGPAGFGSGEPRGYLPLVLRRAEDEPRLVDESTQAEPGDAAAFLIFLEGVEETRAALQEAGWAPAPAPEAAPGEASSGAAGAGGSVAPTDPPA